MPFLLNRLAPDYPANEFNYFVFAFVVLYEGSLSPSAGSTSLHSAGAIF